MATVAQASFKTRPKDVMMITIGSGDDQITVSVLPPSKEIHDDLVKLAVIVDQSINGTIDYGSIDMNDCLAVVGCALSHNTQLRKIDAEYLTRIGFDMSDISEFVNCLLLFLSELAKSKN